MVQLNQKSSNENIIIVILNCYLKQVMILNKFNLESNIDNLCSGIFLNGLIRGNISIYFKNLIGIQFNMDGSSGLS